MYVQPMLASLYRVANEETAKGAQSGENLKKILCVNISHLIPTTSLA